MDDALFTARENDLNDRYLKTKEITREEWVSEKKKLTDEYYRTFEGDGVS